MTRSLRPRISRRRTRGLRRPPSGRPTRIWRNACEVRAWCRSMAGVKRFAMRPGYAKSSATIRTDAPLFDAAETLRWHGATPAFAAWADRMEAPRLLERCEKAAIEKGHS